MQWCSYTEPAGAGLVYQHSELCWLLWGRSSGPRALATAATSGTPSHTTRAQRDLADRCSWPMWPDRPRLFMGIMTTTLLGPVTQRPHVHPILDLLLLARTGSRWRWAVFVSALPYPSFVLTIPSSRNATVVLVICRRDIEPVLSFCCQATIC